MDESSKQLIGEVTKLIPAAPGHPLLKDDEYVRNGVAEIFLEVEPLAGRRHVEVTERRTMIDWANKTRDMLDIRYPKAEKEALRLAKRLEIHHTPKHGSWLNIAEIELSVLKRQCLPERIPDINIMKQKIKTWNKERNTKQAKINWQFKTEDARIKLKRLYPKL
jgi:hypothetical protein